MADSQEEEKTSKSEDDFVDPLGANDPLSRGLEDGYDDLEYDVSFGASDFVLHRDRWILAASAVRESSATRRLTAPEPRRFRVVSCPLILYTVL